MTYDDALLAMKQETWDSLSFASRLEVLQAVENKAAMEVGRIPRTVRGAWLHDGPDSVELGAYDPSDNLIYINNSQLKPGSKYGKCADNLVETVLHEGRHSYQHQVVRDEVKPSGEEEKKAWAENMKPDNYVQFTQNPRAYWEQPIEADARAYASKWLEQLRQERESLGHGESAREVFEHQTSTYGAAMHVAGHQAESSVVVHLSKSHGRGQ